MPLPYTLTPAGTEIVATVPYAFAVGAVITSFIVFQILRTRQSPNAKVQRSTSKSNPFKLGDSSHSLKRGNFYCDDFFVDDSLHSKGESSKKKLTKRISAQELMERESIAIQTSVFKEAETMLAVCDLIYTFTCIRVYARRTGNKELVKIFALPQTSSVLMPKLVRHAEEHVVAFRESRYVDGLAEKAMKAFDIDEMKLAGGTSRISTGAGKTTEVYFCADDESDLRACSVFCITINRKRKRLTVVFRGTTMDQNESGAGAWMTNLNSTLRWERNPIDELANDVPFIHLHDGFARASAYSRKVIFQKINEIRETYPETANFSLYVTGHSLGGALATLFGFYAALNHDVVTLYGPIRVYTFSAPASGDANFARAVRHLEHSGKLMIARIWNTGDPVASAHEIKKKFCHVGVAIELDAADLRMGEGEETSTGKVAGLLLKAFTKPGSLLIKHGTDLSTDHLDGHETFLKGKTLNDLYEEHIFEIPKQH